ncbi:MAG: hypothetical protein WAZ77_22775 [Candidatus Nitrosopolaris sp.]
MNQREIFAVVVLVAAAAIMVSSYGIPMQSALATGHPHDDPPPPSPPPSSLRAQLMLE